MPGFLHDTLAGCDRRSNAAGLTRNMLGLAVMTCMLGLGSIQPASAQMLEGAPPAPTPESLRRRVMASCADDVVRFCPNLSGASSPQNQLICLRPYKSDLSLGCRGAVKAASR